VTPWIATRCGAAIRERLPRPREPPGGAGPVREILLAIFVRLLATACGVLSCGPPSRRSVCARPYPRSAQAPLLLQSKLLLPEVPPLLREVAQLTMLEARGEALGVARIRFSRRGVAVPVPSRAHPEPRRERVIVPRGFEAVFERPGRGDFGGGGQRARRKRAEQRESQRPAADPRCRLAPHFVLPAPETMA
jgi:hypothetical protein